MDRSGDADVLVSAHVPTRTGNQWGSFGSPVCFLRERRRRTATIDDSQSGFPGRVSTACESGGIGRRTRLRIWRVKPWGFESPLSHHTYRDSCGITRYRHYSPHGPAPRVELGRSPSAEGTSGKNSGESSPTERTDMKIRLLAVLVLFLGTCQLHAQDWSSWTTAGNRDVQFRWLGNTPSESGACYLQLRDLKRQPNETTVVTVLVDYHSAQAGSTREVITITGSKDEDQGPSILRPCASVGDVHVKDIVRCGASACAGEGWSWL